MPGFVKKLLILTGLLTLTLTGLNLSPFFKPYFHFSLASLAFFSVISAAIFYIMLLGLTEKQKNRFIAYFGLGLGLKFISSLGFVTITILSLPQLERTNVIPFMILYLIYTIFLSVEITNRLTLFKSIKE